MKRRREQLWLALRFGDLPLVALEDVGSPDIPMVVVERHRVVVANAAARAAGVERDMDLSTARLLADCRAVDRDPEREEALLQRLRNRLYDFTPHIDTCSSRELPCSGLLLEISTCLRLFGGAEMLCNAVLESLEADGQVPAWGVAHTAGGAWLLSFARHELTGKESREVFIEHLNRLPVQVLHDHPRAVDTLVRTGFTTLGDIARQIQGASLDSLTRRLGRAFAEELTAVYGIDRDFSQASLFSRPVPTYRPAEDFRDQVQFELPVSVIDHLKPAIETLLHRLSDCLHQRQQECRHIQWQLSDIRHRRECIDVHAETPQSDWQLLYDLSLIRLERQPLPFEVDCLELVCRDQMPQGDNRLTLDLAGTGKPDPMDPELSVTLARLRARVGDEAVYKVGYRDSILPEWSHAALGLAEQAVRQLPDMHHRGLRPSWLFTPARPIEIRRRRLYWRGYLTLAVGPERMATHWWEASVARDYYLARRQDNLALWVYRDLHRKQWYVHGVFS